MEDGYRDELTLPAPLRKVNPQGISLAIPIPPGLAKGIWSLLSLVIGILLKTDQVRSVLIFVVKTTPQRGETLLTIKKLFSDPFPLGWRVNHGATQEFLLVSNGQYQSRACRQLTKNSCQQISNTAVIPSFQALKPR